MGKVKDYLESKIASIVNSWDDATLAKHTLAKGDSALRYLNQPARGKRGDEERRMELQMDPGNFIYKSEILHRKAYFFNNPLHREIVFTHNTIMSAAIKKIVDAVCSVEPIFLIPDDEKEEDDLEEHMEAKRGWEEIQGTAIKRKALEKSIKHGIILYEPLDIPEQDREWYTNSPFFIRAFDEIKERKDSKHGLFTKYDIHPSNTELQDYTIDITLKKPTTDLHTGLFFDPDNTDDHDGKPWFLGCWNNVHDYEAIKEARNAYDEQIGNGFIVVGVPSKDYPRVKEGIKTKIKNIRREQGLVIPITKDEPMAIEFKGSTFQVDFNADLNDIRRDIIANIGFPERWLFGDSEGAMESSGKDRMQVHDQIKTIFSKWKRFDVLLLKFHGYIKDIKEVKEKAPYELQLTEIEKAEVDRMIAETVTLKSQFLTLDEIRGELGKETISQDQLYQSPELTMKMEQDKPPKDAKTGPDEEKKTDAYYSRSHLKCWINENEGADISDIKAYLRNKDISKEIYQKVGTPNMQPVHYVVTFDVIGKTLPDLSSGHGWQIYDVIIRHNKKNDAEQPYLLLDSIINATPYEDLKTWFGVSRDSIAKIKRTMRENKRETAKTDSIMLDSVELAPNIYQSSGLIVPAQKKYYPEYKANFIRSESQLSKAFEKFKDHTFPLGIYKSNQHDDGINVGEQAQFGEVKLDKVDQEGIYGTMVYDLSKVDEILGKNNWIRKRLQAKQKINTSVGLTSTDIPIEKDTKYEINHIIKSFIATETPRNESAGVD